MQEVFEMETNQDPRNFHRCDLCSYGSKSLFIIVNHIRKHNIRRKTRFFNCDRTYSDLYKCEDCDFETELMVNLKDHINVVHKQIKIKYDMRHILMSYSCRKCGFFTHSLLVLMKHVLDCTKRSHISRKHRKITETIQKSSVKRTDVVTTAEWVECEQCSLMIRHKNNLKRHILTAHGGPDDIKWFQCELCSYKGKRKYHLDKHMLSKHTNPEDVKWLECEYCGMKTKHKNTLRSHMLAKHLGGKAARWFNCAKCAFKTKYKYNLKEHIAGRHVPSNKAFRKFKREQC